MHQTFLCGIVRTAMLCLLVAGSLALTSRPTFAQQTVAPAMSVCQARRAIVTEVQRTILSKWRLISTPTGVEFNVGELMFQAEPSWYKKLFPSGTYSVDLKTLGEVTEVIADKGADEGQCSLRVDGRDPLRGKSYVYLEGNARKNLSSASILGFLAWGKTENAQAFADSMNVLRLYARNFDSSSGLPPPCFTGKDEQARIWVEFQKRAAAWRALPSKPPISDEVNKHWLLAEDELKEKHFDAALTEYEAALEIDPLWPVGQFNAAMLNGELKNYDDAVWHMRCYLELTPNASDAQSAHDQMLLWQAKAEQAAH
jgi:tetratricopeptide (TPR) repeat protein